MYRIGNGYDVHRLVEGRKLILGGVEIPHIKGLDGHSDADALLHAICDALLGACGAGDLGHYFPNNDPKWKDISSLILLERVASLCTERGYKIVNTDAVIVAQRPKLAPYLHNMKLNISQALAMQSSQVNLKATTTEHLGFVGREEGIASYAIALLEKTV